MIEVSSLLDEGLAASIGYALQFFRNVCVYNRSVTWTRMNDTKASLVKLDQLEESILMESDILNN